MITTGDIIFPEAKDRRKVPSQIVRIVLLLSSLPFVSQKGVIWTGKHRYYIRRVPGQIDIIFFSESLKRQMEL